MKVCAHIRTDDMGVPVFGIDFCIGARGHEGVCFCGVFQYSFFSWLLENKKMKFLLTDAKIGGIFNAKSRHKACF
jgi:hypothetical protein